MGFRFVFISANPEMAAWAASNGVDQVMVDLESLGKFERQGHRDTVISGHSFEDISAVRVLVPPGRLLVRVNPINPRTGLEIEESLRRGADTLMLPMFRCRAEVEQFCMAVDGQARVRLLVETIGAMESLAECIRVPGVDEVHIGLNDLHLEMGCRFMFEPLVTGHVERMAETLRCAGVPFGIGGLARAGEGLIPAELILAEHARLGSTAAILSRTFHRQASSVQQIKNQMDFGKEVAKLRQAYEEHLQRSPSELLALHGQLCSAIAQVVAAPPVY